MTEQQKLEVFENIITPLLTQVHSICQKAEIPFLFTISLNDTVEDPVKTAIYIPENLTRNEMSLDFRLATQIMSQEGVPHELLEAIQDVIDEAPAIEARVAQLRESETLGEVIQALQGLSPIDCDCPACQLRRENSKNAGLN